jgi:TonB family protein
MTEKDQEDREAGNRDRGDEATEDVNRDDADLPVTEKEDNKQSDREREREPETEPVRETDEKPVSEEPDPEEQELSHNDTESASDSEEENLLSNNTRETGKKTPAVTSPPGKTPEPYDPALEEDSLSQLDELLDNGTPGDTDTGDTTSDTVVPTSDEDAVPEAGGGPVITWEDNQNRSPLNTPEPEIPSWVAEEGLRLVVEVSFLLTPDGFLTSLRITTSSGYTEIDSRVLEALRKWKFPSVEGTMNVKGRITYVIGIK